MSEPFYAAPGGLSGFAPDPRFNPATFAERYDAAEPADPLQAAWNEGFAAGQADATASACARDAADSEARTLIGQSLLSLDAKQTEALRQKLFLTVEALCEAAVAPFALDKDALASRVERAAAMLSRADDQRVLRLHPDDLALIERQLPAGLTVRSDPALERGSLRVETAHGGVEDGPAHWRKAIAEALGQC